MSISTSNVSSCTSDGSGSAYTVYEESFNQDGRRMLETVNTYLPLAFLYHDEDRISFYLRRMMHIWELKQSHLCTKQVKEDWIRLLMTQLLEKGEKLQIHIQIKIMNIINALYRHEKDFNLAFDWKQLYDYLARYHLNDSTRSISIFSTESMSHHVRSLVKMIAKSRRYFIGGGAGPANDVGGFASPIPQNDGSVGQEVLTTFIPFLSPFDNKYFASQALICLFFPSHLRYSQAHPPLGNGQTPAATMASYQKLVKLYTPFTQNLIDYCPLTIQLNIQLYARMAKHGLGVETGEGAELLDPFFTKNMQTFFATFLQTLELDIGGKGSQNMQRGWIVYTEFIHGSTRQGNLVDLAEQFAKLVAYTLHRGQNEKDETKKKSSTQGLLTALLYTLRTYVHPSQTSGRAWHDAIGTFLVRVAKHYVKRLGREIRGEVSYSKKYFLDPNNYDFVLAIQPIALQGLYSKTVNMVSQCDMCLRHLATFFPNVILPGLMSSVEQSLVDVNTSHRMMSNLQVLTTIANVVFNGEISVGTAGGAPWLMNLMNLSLPGVDITDPLKTSFTMTWLAILFYLIPLIDARDGGKGGEEETPLPDAKKLTPAARYALQAANVTQEQYSEAVEQARTATMQFEEWSLAYVDTIVKLLGSSDKFAKSDYADRACARLLYKNMRAFFAACSPKIFQAVSQKLIKLIISSHHPTSQKLWGVVVHTMSLGGNAEEFLKAFVPHALKKLVVKDAIAPLADSELEWYTHLIGQSVKQAGGASDCADARKAGMKGELLLPYVAPIQQVYTLLQNHDSKSVRKNARKMIRNLLKGLTFTYPAEWKNFSPTEDWNRIKGSSGKPGWDHWKHWGMYHPRFEHHDGLPQIDLIWHVPTEAEMKAAEGLVVHVLKEPLTWLAGWIDGKVQDSAAADGKDATEEKKDPASSPTVAAVGKGDTPLERSLQKVISLLRGIQPVLGVVEGPEWFATANQDEDDHDQAYTNAGKDHGARCPMVYIVRTQPVKLLDGVVSELLGIKTQGMKDQPAVASLRTHLLRITHQAFVRARTLAAGPIHSQPSTKSTTLLLKLSAQVLTGYGSHEQHLHSDRQNGKYSRHRLRDWLTGWKARLRPQLVQKCYDFHLIRMNELSYNEVYTRDVHDLIEDLQHAATNEFTKIRSKATYLLISGLRRFPQAIDMTLDAMLAVFSNPTGKTSDESLLGCMGVLVDHSMSNWIARKWSRMSKFVQTFFKHGQHTSKDDKVQLLVQQLFNNLFPSFQVKTVQVPLVDVARVPANLAGIIDASKVARRNQSIQKFNKKLSRTYLELMTFLYNNSTGQVASVAASSATGGETKEAALAHWRYSLMSSAFFFSLSRAQHYNLALSQVDSTDGFITYQQYVTFFLKGLTSTLAPLRLISFLAVSKILGTHSLYVRGELNKTAELALGSDPGRILAIMDSGSTSPVDPAASLSKQGSILTFTPIESEEEMKKTIFYDYLYSGWMGDVYNTVVCKYTDNTLADPRYKHYNAYTYFTPLSVQQPLRFPYKPLSTTEHTPAPPLPDVSLATIQEFFTSNGNKNLQLLLDNFVYNHPSLAPTHEGASNERAGDGAGDQIATLAIRNVVRNKLFPTTRFNAKSAAFNMIHVNVIRGLAESFPEIVTKDDGSGLSKLILDLIKATEEPDKACTAAEVLCGLTVACKHFNLATQEGFRKVLLPLWSQALQTVQPDCLDHYGDSLRHIYTNMDPRRLAWLSKHLFIEALNELPSQDFIAENLANAKLNPRILDTKGETMPGAVNNLPPSPSASAVTAARNVATNANESPSVQFKRLRFLLPILIEVGFRGTKLGEWMVTTFKKKGFLYHPYKQVREEISWILFILTRNEFQLAFNHPAQSPGGSIVEPSDRLCVVSSPVYLQFLHYIRDQFDSVKALYREDKANPSGSPKPSPSPQPDGTPATPGTTATFLGADPAFTKHIEQQKDRAKNFTETILTWLHATLVCGDAVFISTFYQAFLPYVLWAQHHPDPEIGAIAKFAGTGAAWINAGGQALEPVSPAGVTEPAQGVSALHDAESLPYVQALSLTDPHPRRAPLDSPSLVIDNILSNLRATTLAPENSWHVRVAVAKFLQIWLPRHSLSLNAKQLKAVEDLLIDSLLVDPQIEVREAASQAFSSFISSSFPLTLPTKESLAARKAELQDMGEEEPTGTVVLEPHPHIKTMTKKLQKLVLESSGKKSGGKATLDGNALAQRHGGLLGLTGLVLTHPYDIPSHVPALLSFLAQYVEDRNQNVSSSLRKFFASFTSSHKDEWATFQKMFTMEQLEELQSMQLAPSYFA